MTRSVCLARLSGEKMFIEGVLIDNSKRFSIDYTGWSYNNSYLYYALDTKYYKSKNDFESKKLLDTAIVLSNISRWYDYDDNYKIFSTISNDSLRVYSVADDKLVGKYDLKTINYLKGSSPIITNNKIYIHVIDKITSITDKNTIPDKIYLSQNYPNPFNPSTTIQYTIPVAKFPSGEGNQRGVLVTLKVYDMLGREVATLVNEEKAPGTYEVKFSVETLHATSLPSGIYFYRMQCGSFTGARKMILLK